MTTETTQLATVDVAMAEFAEDIEILAAEAARASKGGGDMAWLPNWYLRTLTELGAVKDKVKEQAAVILKQIDGRKKALEWRYGREFMAQVSKDITEHGGKKKSIDYLSGRAGYRTVGGTPKVIIDNDAEALANAELLCPAAIKKSLLVAEVLAYCESTGDVLDGTHVEIPEKHDEFYPKVAQPLLIGDSDGNDPK